MQFTIKLLVAKSIAYLADLGYYMEKIGESAIGISRVKL